MGAPSLLEETTPRSRPPRRPLARRRNHHDGLVDPVASATARSRRGSRRSARSACSRRRCFVFSAGRSACAARHRRPRCASRATAGGRCALPWRISSRHPRRTSVIATAVGAAVGLACVLGALIPATRATILKSELISAGSDVGVATLPLNNSSNVDSRPSPALLEGLRNVPGVARVNRTFAQEITDVRRRVLGPRVRGVDRWAFEPRHGRDGQRTCSIAARLSSGRPSPGSATCVRDRRCGSRRRRVTSRVRVAGVWVSSFDNGYTVTISPERFTQLFGTPAPHGVTADADPGVSAARARAADRARGDRSRCDRPHGGRVGGRARRRDRRTGVTVLDVAARAAARGARRDAFDACCWSASNGVGRSACSAPSGSRRRPSDG